MLRFRRSTCMKRILSTYSGTAASYFLLLVALVAQSFPQCCVQTVTLNPGDDIQAAVDANPEGTKFILNAGVYHTASVIPKDYDQFIGNPARQAVLSGSTVVNNF